MESYYGTKLILAEPKQKAVNTPEGDVGFMDGYKVIYDNNYESWSPADVFDASYRKSGNLLFGHAIEALKAGKKIARNGWNGKGMYLELQVPDEHSKMSLPYIYMKTACDNLVPWLASQTDVLAEDWGIITLTNEA